MKYWSRFFVLGLFALFSACAREKMWEEQSPIAHHPLNEYRISREEALSSLRSVAKDLYSYDLRSSSQDKLSEIARLIPSSLSPVLFSSSQMRVGESLKTMDIDTMIYIVNFAESRGFAILAADRRLGVPILAVTDSGSISRSDFESHSLILMSEEERRKEIPDFQAYSPELDDYSVGAELQDFGANLIGNITQNFLNKTVTTELTSINGEKDLNNYPEKGKQGRDQNDNVGYFWKEIGRVNALLDTKWHQWYPFNDWCPERRRTLKLFGPKRKAPAGCVGIAVAQIFAFHEKPSYLEYYGNVVDWKTVKTICPYDNIYYPQKPEDTASEEDKRAHIILRDQAAALAMAVGDGVKTSWGYSGSTAFPCNAARYMRKSGYSMATRRWGLNKEMILEMLDNRRPVILSANAGLFGGHAWVVDGYIQYQLEIERKTDKGVVIEKSKERKELLHCNFGWRGLCDGYYTSSIFDTGSSPEERDDKDTNLNENEDPSKYTWLFSIITY